MFLKYEFLVSNFLCINYREIAYYLLFCKFDCPHVNVTVLLFCKGY